MKLAAWWMPGVPPGADRMCRNDVCAGHRSLIYVSDRIYRFSSARRSFSERVLITS